MCVRGAWARKFGVVSCDLQPHISMHLTLGMYSSFRKPIAIISHAHLKRRNGLSCICLASSPSAHGRAVGQREELLCFTAL